MREDQGVPDDGVLTAPLRLADDGPADRPAEVPAGGPAGGPAEVPAGGPAGGPAEVPAGAGGPVGVGGIAEPVAVGRGTTTEVDPGPVRAFGQDVERLADLVGRLAAAASTLGERLDGEVRGALDSAEQALAEAQGARAEAADADDRTRQAEERAEAALKEAADAREELLKVTAAAQASVSAAQESEANAWKEAGASQQARATAANEAAHADGLRKRAESLWGTEHQARADAERERDDLAVRLTNEQTALATARTELATARAELTEARDRLEAAGETERQLRAELAAAKGEIAGLSVERDSVVARATELATRADRAEERADAAEIRAERAEQRADAAEIRIDRDATTARALQDTLRAALDLPSVEELSDGGGVGVRVGESAAVTVQPGALIGVDQVPDVMDGELAARFARAILAVRVHQATRRSVHDDDPSPAAVLDTDDDADTEELPTED
ncbi:hypothetical protein [Actinomadura sp. 9N215]|uniref:hypothetical protein n=1 Tax=Actinomadura sp. 9N215 TaxID=3375150 RepID=UPI0037A620DE